MDTGSAFNGMGEQYGGAKGLSRIDIARRNAAGANAPENNRDIEFTVAQPRVQEAQQIETDNAPLPLKTFDQTVAASGWDALNEEGRSSVVQSYGKQVEDYIDSLQGDPIQKQAEKEELYRQLNAQNVILRRTAKNPDLYPTDYGETKPRTLKFENNDKTAHQFSIIKDTKGERLRVTLPDGKTVQKPLLIEEEKKKLQTQVDVLQKQADNLPESESETHNVLLDQIQEKKELLEDKEALLGKLFQDNLASIYKENASSFGDASMAARVGQYGDNIRTNFIAGTMQAARAGMNIAAQGLGLLGMDDWKKAVEAGSNVLEEKRKGQISQYVDAYDYAKGGGQPTFFNKLATQAGVLGLDILTNLGMGGLAKAGLKGVGTSVVEAAVEKGTIGAMAKAGAAKAAIVGAETLPAVARQALEQAQTEYDAAKTALKDDPNAEKKALAVFYGNLATTGAGEFFPFRNIAKIAGVNPDIFLNKVIPKLTPRLREALSEAGAETLTETLQQFSTNAFAKGFYDKNRDLFEGIGESAAMAMILGAASGGAVGGVAHAEIKKALQEKLGDSEAAIVEQPTAPITIEPTSEQATKLAAELEEQNGSPEIPTNSATSIADFVTVDRTAETQPQPVAKIPVAERPQAVADQQVVQEAPVGGETGTIGIPIEEPGAILAQEQLLGEDETPTTTFSIRQKQNFDQATAEGKIPVTAGSLSLGQKIDIEGNKIKVVNIKNDEEGNPVSVELEDGSLFGRQTVKPDEVIFAEQITPASQERQAARTPGEETRQDMNEEVTRRVDDFVKSIFPEGGVELLSNEEMRKASGLPKGQNALGYSILRDKKIFLNKDKLTPNTTLHEASHLWEVWAKKNEKEVHQQGRQLIQNSPYFAEIQKSESYQKLASRLKPEERPAFFTSEALANAIADKGEKIVNSTQRKKFKEWLDNLWTKIKEKFGFTNLTTEQIQNLKLDEFTRRVAGDILSGGERGRARIAKRSTPESRRTAIQQPIQTNSGKLRESIAYRKMYGAFKQELDEQNVPTYEASNHADQAALAAAFGQQNPELLEKIVMGEELPPEGQSLTALRAYALAKSFAEGDLKAANEIGRKDSLHATRTAQELSQRNFGYKQEDISSIMAIALEQKKLAALDINFTEEGSIKEKAKESYKKKVQVPAEKAAKKAARELKKKMEHLDKFFDSLKC